MARACYAITKINGKTVERILKADFSAAKDYHEYMKNTKKFKGNVSCFIETIDGKDRECVFEYTN